MTLKIELDPQLERRLLDEAAKSGLEPAELARRLLERTFSVPAHAKAGPPDVATSALLEQWADEDRTDDQEELARRQRESDELMKALEDGRHPGPQQRAVAS